MAADKESVGASGDKRSSLVTFIDKNGLEFNYPAPHIIVVDGVRISFKLLEIMVCQDYQGKWVRFERDGDEVTVHERREDADNPV